MLTDQGMIFPTISKNRRIVYGGDTESVHFTDDLNNFLNIKLHFGFKDSKVFQRKYSRF
jgi:hypothetical protein